MSPSLSLVNSLLTALRPISSCPDMESLNLETHKMNSLNGQPLCLLALCAFSLVPHGLEADNQARLTKGQEIITYLYAVINRQLCIIMDIPLR